MQIIGKHPFLLFCCHFPQNSRWTKTSYQESVSLSAHFSKFPSVSVRAGKRWEIMVIAGFNARADRQTHSCVLHTRVHTHAFTHTRTQTPAFASPAGVSAEWLFPSQGFLGAEGQWLREVIRRNIAETKPSLPQSCLSLCFCWSSSFGLNNKCDLNPGPTVCCISRKPTLGTSFATPGMGNSPIRRCSTKH